MGEAVDDILAELPTDFAPYSHLKPASFKEIVGVQWLVNLYNKPRSPLVRLQTVCKIASLVSEFLPGLFRFNSLPFGSISLRPVSLL